MSQVGSRLGSIVLGVVSTDIRSSGIIIGNWAGVVCARAGGVLRVDAGWVGASQPCDK